MSRAVAFGLRPFFHAPARCARVASHFHLHVVGTREGRKISTMRNHAEPSGTALSVIHIGCASCARRWGARGVEAKPTPPLRPGRARPPRACARRAVLDMRASHRRDAAGRPPAGIRAGRAGAGEQGRLARGLRELSWRSSCMQPMETGSLGGVSDRDTRRGAQEIRAVAVLVRLPRGRESRSKGR